MDWYDHVGYALAAGAAVYGLWCRWCLSVAGMQLRLAEAETEFWRHSIRYVAESCDDGSHI